MAQPIYQAVEDDDAAIATIATPPRTGPLYIIECQFTFSCNQYVKTIDRANINRNIELM
jgi:hypothetical protein